MNVGWLHHAWKTLMNDCTYLILEYPFDPCWRNLPTSPLPYLCKSFFNIILMLQFAGFGLGLGLGLHGGGGCRLRRRLRLRRRADERSTHRKQIRSKHRAILKFILFKNIHINARYVGYCSLRMRITEHEIRNAILVYTVGLNATQLLRT